MLGVIVGTLPRRHRQAIARVSVSALLASLPLLYVSLLRPPPAALAGDTAFWFLMSNCVIAAIVATADDPGTLFFGSSNDDDHEDPCDRQPVLPLAGNEPVPAGCVVQEDVVACSASPSLVEAETARRNAENKLGTDLLPSPHKHVSALQRGEQQQETETAIELQSTDQNNNTAAMVRGHEEGEEMAASQTPTPASEEAYIPVGKQNAIGKADRALTAEPEAEHAEPWVVPKLLTSKSLPDQEEEAAADEEWPLAHADKGGRLRRSATDGSKSSVAEESEYWQLSDEELNRRVEDFIARFNRQMRLQIEQEARV